MESLWPDRDPETANKDLYRMIYRARRALEPGLEPPSTSRFILTQGSQVMLRAPGGLWLDVAEFEACARSALKGSAEPPLEQALAIYEGDLLPEDLYEEWTMSARERLHSLYRQLVLALAQSHEARGEYKASQESLRDLLACEPTDETAHRQLMRLYALSGHRPQALQQYQECCAVLKREMDVAPEPATVDLHRKIVEGHLSAGQARVAQSEQTAASHMMASGHDRQPNLTPGDFSDNLIGETDALAVLPFIKESTDAEAEYLADGLTESLINLLAQLPGVRVMSRASVFRFKGSGVDPQEVGRRLNVRTVLLGHMRQFSRQLIINAELISVEHGTQLWGANLRRPMTDVFAIQEEIAQEIAGKLKLSLGSKALQTLHVQAPTNTDVYLQYLEGRFHWNRRTARALQTALTHFRKAISLDPYYAPAYVGLSDCYMLMGTEQPRLVMPQAREATLKALTLDDSLSEAHASLGFTKLCFDYNWGGAEVAFQRALGLNPNYAPAYQWYAMLLRCAGRDAERLSMISRAAVLDPLSPSISLNMGFYYYFTEQYERALEHWESTLELSPGYAQTHWAIGLAHEQQGRYVEAVAAFERAIELSKGEPGMIADLGHVYAMMGRERHARRVLKELRELSTRRYVCADYLALIHLALGETDEVFNQLERAYEERSQGLIWLKVDPWFKPLRSDPRFQDLTRRVGIPS